MVRNTKCFRNALWVAGLGVVISLLYAQTKKDRENVDRPNILIILADDLGYADLGCYGSEINTPNIDMLANRGIRFTQFYTSARCCPSRASLLTGLFPHQAGIGSFAGGDKGVPGYRGRLKENTVTIAEVLKSAGYHTMGSGKWHVNFPGPTDRGFEEFYGFLEDYGVDGWKSKWMQRYPADRAQIEYKEGEFFATTAITDYALKFLDSANLSVDKPWFLYLAYQAVHFPLQAPRSSVDKYKDVYHVGWDTIRQRRFEKMKALGVISDQTFLSARGEFVIPAVGIRNQVPGDGLHNPPWNALSKDRQADLARRMAVYAGMLDNMDHNIGRILQYLQATDQFESTLIFFLSDNGACGEWDAFGFEYPDYNARVSGATTQHPNVLHEAAGLDKLGGPDGPLFSYGSGWANVGNTPFTLYKMFTHEGGISSPFIMHWPQAIDKPRIVKHNYGHLVDIMATCLKVAGASYPASVNGQRTLPPEGVDIFKLLEDTVMPRVLTFEHSGHPAIIEGDWKLVGRRGTLGKMDFTGTAYFELYNLKDDRSETNDLSTQYPEKATELRDKMRREFLRVGVFPRPN